MNIDGSREAKIGVESVEGVPRRSGIEETCLPTQSLNEREIAAIVSRGLANLFLLEGLQLGWIRYHATLRHVWHCRRYIPLETRVELSSMWG